MGYMGIQFSDTPIFQKQLIIRCVLYHFKMYVLICILYVYTYIYIYIIYCFQVPFIVLILEFLHLGFFPVILSSCESCCSSQDDDDEMSKDGAVLVFIVAWPALSHACSTKAT